jgi:hypothetical protein
MSAYIAAVVTACLEAASEARLAGDFTKAEAFIAEAKRLAALA